MAPADFSTLIDLLAYRAEVSAGRAAFTFHGQPCSFAGLWQGINRFALFLQAHALPPQECVVVALPNHPEFFSAFYGIQRAGGIAVPVFPEAGIERIFSLAALCGAHWIVAPSDMPQSRLAQARAAGETRRLRIITVAEAAAEIPALPPSKPAQFPAVQPGDIAFLQYTSGSTGNPKGVMLTHAGLLANIRQMIAGMEITPQEIFVSWLPVYHDMGLILKTMVPFYLAAQVHLLPADLRDVRPWLEAIQRQRATFTAAPDFAYRLILRHVAPDAYDLSSLRVALNAAEPVRATTMQAFERMFQLKDVMVAGYGLAEATVGVSMWKPRTPALVDNRGRVSVGRPFPDVALRIHQDGVELPAGQIGEIAICSKANSLGYYNNPEETRRLFWKDGYFHTGDLGYLDEHGCLFIASRKKNIIKRAGETISPQEIEEVMDATPGVRFSAAVGIDKGGSEGEQVYVFVEARDPGLGEDAFYEITLGMVEQFYAHLGFRPARIYVLKPRTIPLTHNGKIQHGRLKELYLNGSLRQQGAIVYPGY
jgi:acyl-CoA synthetase (AMP-forming)/AMP-acid ligase II